MILPAFGITSHIISTFSRKPLFGHSSMVYAMVSIAVLSFVVWAHHMFTVGMPLAAELFFMWATMIIAIPTKRRAEIKLDLLHLQHRRMMFQNMHPLIALLLHQLELA